jgi:tRNA-specific 2-thiouridylase
MIRLGASDSDFPQMSDSAVVNTQEQNPERACVAVALSGGVDSAVAAALLVQQGYRVIGMMMRLWSESGHGDDNRCCTPEAMAKARRVAGILGIPFYAIDAQEFFHKTVVRYFLEGYSSGITPNPCLVCNREVRWEFLLSHALSFGADYLATGHYARVVRSQDGRLQLHRAVDKWKDQSYVLHVLSQDQLARALFPLGEFTKTQVREMARQFGLPVAARPESQDLCFLGNGDYRGFITRNAPAAIRPGPIVNTQSEVIGTHQGLAFYTIGQRKGLGLSSPAPLYVLEKDIERNTIMVGTIEELGKSELTVERMNWVSRDPPNEPIRSEVKIRYRAEETPATIHPFGQTSVRIAFDEPVRGVTPGQAAVCFQGDICLGGGIITSSK